MTDTVQIWGRVNILLLVTFALSLIHDSKPINLDIHELNVEMQSRESFQVCMSCSNLGKQGKNIVLV